jgi:type II secretory pathway component PulC
MNDDDDSKTNDEINEVNSSDNFTGEFEHGTGEFEHEEYNPTKIEKLKDFAGNIRFQISQSFSKLLDKRKTFKLPNEENGERNIKVNFLDKVSYQFKKLEISKVVERVFSSDSRSSINKYTIIALIAIGTYGVGKTLALVLQGKETTKLAATATEKIETDTIQNADFNQIKLANVFKTDSDKPKVVSNSSEKQEISKEKCTKATKTTSLKLKLLNTIVLQDTVKSVASVQVRGSILENFREGEKIDNMAQIDRITRLGVILKNLKTGQCENLMNENQGDITSPKIAVMSPRASRQYKKKKRKMKGISNEGNNYKIKKSIIDEQLKDLSSLLQEAKAIKITNPDGTLSFKIVEISPGGIFSTLGIENQDTISQINGAPITSMNQIMALFGKMRKMSSLNLTVGRTGTTQSMNYSFE